MAMLNSTVRVYWTKERRWFRGTIDGERDEDGDRIDNHKSYRPAEEKEKEKEKDLPPGRNNKWKKK